MTSIQTYDGRMPYFCNNCVWSKPERESSWNLRCFNPKVNAKDDWALGSVNMPGSDCRTERGKTWIMFPACGMSGKQYKSKLDSDPKL